jgi:ubiquinone/menaquinone biosynthesis C-methylase UbiE
MKHKSLYDDLYASGYHNKFGFTHSKPLIAKLKKYLTPGVKILDAGCSNGTAVKLMQDLGYDAYGVDISTVAIKIAKANKVPNCKVSSVSKIAHPSNSFHALLSTDVLEHLDPSEANMAESEFYRVLKSRGTLFLNIALKMESNSKWKKWVKNSKYDLKCLHTLIQPKIYWERLFSTKRYNHLYSKIHGHALTLILRKK